MLCFMLEDRLFAVSDDALKRVSQVIIEEQLIIFPRLSLPCRKVEQRFHMCDRMAIYFFIAASYSPWWVV